MVEIPNEIKEKLANAPFFSLGKVEPELFNRFTRLKRFLEETEKSEQSRILNNEDVTGVWYFTDLALDECRNPQLLVRTTHQEKSMEYLFLCAAISEFIKQDVVHLMENLLYDELIFGVCQELVGEIMKGRILTIYDKEREAL